MTTKKQPLIPGFTFNDHDKLLRDNHYKRQIFNVAQNCNVVKDTFPEEEKQIGGIGAKQVEDLVAEYYQRPKSDVSGHKPPPRFVLRFFVYFKEGVSESSLEKFRVRKCILYYFLEDGTMQVCEPREDNSCLNQGTLVKRHLVFNEETKKNFTHMDLSKLGGTVLVYGKRFKLTGCDQFTREFFQKLGIDLGESLDYPFDKYRLKGSHGKRSDAVVKLSETDWELKRFLEYSFKGRRCNLTESEKYLSKQFFRNDGKVLQFFAVWDDRKRLHGEYRTFVIQYFLSNDCIKVAERLPPNAGRENFPVFVRKSLMAKPGTNVNYHWKDLSIGQRVTFLSRCFFLYDCDKFTREYYRTKGMVQSTPIDVVLALPPPVVYKPPPHNGFGTEEDTLNSWKYLFMKPVRKDVQRLIAYDKVSLRFAARMLTPEGQREVKNRKFVVNFHLADNTVSVFEPEERNSGIRGGKFVERRKLKNPDTGKNFDEVDIFVGANLNITEFRFLLYDTDERTLKFMEKNKDTFLRSNVEYILNKVKIRNPNFGGVNEKISVAKFSEIVRPFLDCDHEMITLVRRFCVAEDVVDFTQFLKEYQASYDLFEEKRILGVETMEQKKTTAQQAEMVYKIFKEDYNERPFLFQKLFKSEIDKVPFGRFGYDELELVCKDHLIPRNVVRMVEEDIPLLSSVVFKHQKILDLHELVRELRVKHYN